MREFTVNIPKEAIISNLGFAGAVIQRANTYTSDEISLKLGKGPYVNAKSMLGLLSLRYDLSDTITIQVIGENENYSAPNFERFLEKLIALYIE